MIEWVGWYGVLAIVIAYTLNTFSVLDPQSIIYLLLNLSGALAIIYEASSKKDAQPVILNIVWATVAVVAIGNLILK